MSPLLIGAGALGLLCSASALLLLKADRSQGRLADRIAFVQAAAGIETSSSRADDGSGLLRWIATLGRLIARSGLLSDKTVTELELTLSVAGFRGKNGLGLFVGSKMLLFAGLPTVGWFGLGALGASGLVHLAGTAMAGILGLLGPDYVVRTMRAAYLKRLDRGLPDALDMMVICSEAGLPLEPTISRVASEIAYTHRAVADELQQTATELRLLSDRRVALLNMGSRTGLETLKRLGSTLVQTMQYGTPLSQALRQLSAELRTEMRPASTSSKATCWTSISPAIPGAAYGRQGKLRVVGNLPYNISTPILFHLLEAAAHIEDQHVMLQREVVARMAAGPGGQGLRPAQRDAAMALRDRADPRRRAPEAFDPPPRVDSSVVRMRPRAHPPPPSTRPCSKRSSRVAFSQRRKLLRHTLAVWLDAREDSPSFDVQTSRRRGPRRGMDRPHRSAQPSDPSGVGPSSSRREGSEAGREQS